MRVEVITTAELGDRSYVADDGDTAVVVDPQRDIDRVEAVIARLGVTVGLVCETHIHNDYVTGGYELARRTGARYLVSAEDDVAFDRTPVRDGDEVTAGRLTVRAVATPGHTPSHLSYVVSDAGDPDAAPAVFTGGSLLYGSVGRTDLVDPDRTIELTRAQYRSARRLAAGLPDGSPVFPAHGFGSFCSAGSATGGETSTVGAERSRNDALTTDDEDDFVRALVANLTAYPAYYAHMAPLNRAGPAAPDLSPPERVDPVELGKRIAGGPITLIGNSPEQISAAQRQLVRIGIDRPAGAATGDLDTVGAGHDRRAYPRVDFAAVAADATGSGDVVLDVRRHDERARGHLPGSVHVPLNELLTRLVDRAGRDVVLVDDDFDPSTGTPA